MNKEQLQSQIDDIDESVLAFTLTVEMINAQILALLQQKEQLVHERNKLKTKRNPVGFNLNQKSNEQNTPPQQTS